jgi:hypothetical protein
MTVNGLRASVHLPSLLLGLLPAALALRSSSPQTATDSLPSGQMTWRQIVRVEENFPYTVPPKCTLVVTSSGYTSRNGVNIGVIPTTPLVFEVDGQPRLLLDPVDGPNEIQPGWVVPAGGRVSVRFGDDDTLGYLFGFLVEG